MDDPSIFGQRFPGDTGLQLPHAGAVQVVLQAQRGQRGSAFGPMTQYRSEPQQPQPVAPAQLFSQLLGNPAALAQLQGIQDVGQAEPKPTRSRGRAASGGAGGQAANNGVASVSYASRHQQAEARRRSRINERLEALRRVVPHSERANTATFLEEVLKYVEGLQQRVTDLEGRLGLEPTVKCDPVPRFTDGAGAASAAPEPSTLTGGTSDNLATQSLLEQQQPRPSGGHAGRAAPAGERRAQSQPAAQQQQQQQQQGDPLCLAAVDFWGVGVAAPNQQLPLGRSAQAGSLFSSHTASGGGAPAPRPAGRHEELPSVSEELEMAAALTAPPRAGSAAAAAAMMAESQPPASLPLPLSVLGPSHSALAQLAQQAQLVQQAAAQQTALEAGRPPASAGRELFSAGGPQGTLSGRSGGGRGPSSPITNSLLQQAAQALLGSAAFVQPPLMPQQLQLPPGQNLQNVLGAPHHQLPRGGFPGALPPQARPPMPLPASRDPSAQLQYHLMAAQQAAHAVAQQSLSGGAPQQAPQHFDLQSALLPLSASLPHLAAGQSPALSAPARAMAHQQQQPGGAPPVPSPSAAATPAAAAPAVGRELSHSARSQQTQHTVAPSAAAGPGPPGLPAGGAAAAATLGKRAAGADPPLPPQEQQQQDAKRRKLPERPTVSF